MEGITGWLLPLALILGGGATISTALIGDQVPIPGDLLLWLAAGVVTGSCIVLLPSLRPGLLPCMRAALLAGFAFLLLSAWWLPQPQLMPLLLRMAAGVGILLFALGSICSLLHRFTGSRHSAAWWVVLATGLLSSAPIWSGPLVEALSAGRQAIDAIIACSPLSYLAALAEWDYLRGEWFYRHTPFGGFRYDYPSPVTGSLIYLGTGLACHLMSHLLDAGKDQKNRLNSPATASHP